MEHSLQGQLLVSTHASSDDDFGRSIVAVCDHHSEGAFGLMLNKPATLTLSEMLLDLELAHDPEHITESIYIGGPVSQDRGFVLHSSGKRWPNTIEITPQLFLTTSSEILEDIAKGLAPTHYRVYLGCSAWSPGQLEEELMKSDWLTLPASRKLIFRTEAESQFEQALADIGIELSQLSQCTGDIQ